MSEINDEIKTKCHKMCLQYVWPNVNPNQLQLHPLRGGITNQMFYCKLNSNESNVKEIAIKLYRMSERPLNSDNSVLNDIIIGLIVSNEGLGPKIYGISSDAVVMQYYECHQFNKSDQKNERIVTELGQRLAKVHSLKPPINKTNHWFYETFNERNVNSYKSYENNELINDLKLNNFIKNDFKSEVIFITKVMEESDSPIVFTHNDFGFNNILVKNNCNEKEIIVLIDFEFSSYGMRGRDFGIVFNDFLDCNEMVYQSNCQQIIEPFLKSYLNESQRIFGQNYTNDEKNSFKHLVYETKVFLLLQKLFSVLYYLNDNQNLLNDSKVNILRKANEMFGEYLKLKQILIEENVLKI